MPRARPVPRDPPRPPVVSRRKWRERNRESLEAVRQLKAHLATGEPMTSPEAARLHRVWLHRNIVYNPLLRLHPRTEAEVVPPLFSALTEGRTLYKLDEKRGDLERLCANLLQGRMEGRPVSVGLAEKDWKRTRRSRATYFTVELIRLLRERGMIGVQRGSHDPRTGRGYRTRIWAHDNLVGWLQDPSGRFRPPETEWVGLVNLKDADGNLVDFEPCPTSVSVDRVLRRAGLVAKGRRVTYRGPDGPVRLATQLHAVFTRRWDLHGRLYTSRNGYQTLTRQERATIEIDGEPTVELDFSAMHPRLLYAWAGEQYDGDPYTAVGAPGWLRPVLKRLFLRMINAGSRRAAVAGGNLEQFEDPWTRRSLRRAGLTVKRLVGRFEAAHPAIRDHLYRKDTGLRLMNQDSRVALAVLDRFARAGAPVLCVHDSFLAAAPLEADLRAAMSECYEAVTGGFSCPVKPDPQVPDMARQRPNVL